MIPILSVLNYIPLEFLLIERIPIVILRWSNPFLNFTMINANSSKMSFFLTIFRLVISCFYKHQH